MKLLMLSEGPMRVGKTSIDLFSERLFQLSKVIIMVYIGLSKDILEDRILDW